MGCSPTKNTNLARHTSSLDMIPDHPSVDGTGAASILPSSAMPDVVHRSVGIFDRKDPCMVVVPSNEVIMGLGRSVDVEDNISILRVENFANQGLVPLISSWQEGLANFTNSGVGQAHTCSQV